MYIQDERDKVNMQFKDYIKKDKPKVYLIQEIPGTSKENQI